MKHLKLKRLRSRGDTIIEVLIVLAILGLAFSISTATASRGLNKSRNAQEHSQALGILNAQIELLRTAISKDVNVFIGTPFCMVSATALDSSFPAGYSVPASAAADANNEFVNYPAACKKNEIYNLSIVYNSSNNFTLRVRWSGIGGLGAQQETMNYRVHKLAKVEDPGIVLTAAKPQINVIVSKVRPVHGSAAGWAAGEATPSCSSNDLQQRGGASVTLTQTNGSGLSQSKVTLSNSSALFDQNIVEGGTYRATVNAVPAGFTLCPPNPSGQITATPSTVPHTIQMKMIPQCWPDPRRDYYGYYSDYQGYFADYLGYYSDPPYMHYKTVYWNYHGGPDGKYHPNNHFSFGQGDIIEGVWAMEWRYRPDLSKDGRAFHEGWPRTSGIGQAGFYSDPPYHHYSAPYDHWTAPYDHYGPWYNYGVCAT